MRQGPCRPRTDHAKSRDIGAEAGLSGLVTYPTFRTPKRLLVGHPMRSNQMAETLLPKRLALPVYCSDAISSNAYATQEILLVLALGGAAMVLATPWVALVVVGLLGLVTLSYQQTCHAYPNGGGAYAVSKANLGRNASLIAAAALLVDYVMTVAVSVAASVENLTFAIPTYAFILSVFAMLGAGFYQVLMGHTPVAESAPLGFAHGGPLGAALII